MGSMIIFKTVTFSVSKLKAARGAGFRADFRIRTTGNREKRLTFRVFLRVAVWTESCDFRVCRHATHRVHNRALARVGVF